MSFKYNILAGLAMALAAAPAAASPDDCRIEIAEDGAMATISAYASGEAPSTGNYVMDTEVSSGGNRSVSRQAGTYEIGLAHEPVLLARSVVGRNPASEIHVRVTLSASGETVECSNGVR